MQTELNNGGPMETAPSSAVFFSPGGEKHRSRILMEPFGAKFRLHLGTPILRLIAHAWTSASITGSLSRLRAKSDMDAVRSRSWTVRPLRAGKVLCRQLQIPPGSRLLLLEMKSPMLEIGSTGSWMLRLLQRLCFEFAWGSDSPGRPERRPIAWSEIDEGYRRWKWASARR